MQVKKINEIKAYINSFDHASSIRFKESRISEDLLRSWFTQKKKESIFNSSMRVRLEVNLV